VRLRVGSSEYQSALSVRADPRIGFDPAGAAAALALIRGAQRSLSSLTDVSLEVGYLKDQLDAAAKQLPANDKKTAAAIADVKKRLEPLTDGEDDASPHLDSIGEALRALYNDVEGSDAAPTEPQHEVLAACDERLQRATKLWQGMKASSLATLNAALERAGTPPIVIPPVDQIHPSAVSPGVERP